MVGETSPAAAAEPTPCGSLPECEEYKRCEDKGYSRRRAWYIGLCTAFSLIVSATLVFLHYDGPMAQQYVTGLLSFAGTICICYLGAGVIDRSEILHKIGDGWRHHGDEEERK